MDSDDEGGKWTSIRYTQRWQGKSKGKNTNHQPTEAQPEAFKPGVVEKVAAGIRECTHSNSKLVNAVSSEVVDHIPRGSLLDIIMLGIGELTNGASVLQFALILELARCLLAADTVALRRIMWYDPITGKSEETSGLRAFLGASKSCPICERIEILEKNVFGCYDSQAGEDSLHTLVFAPHCPRPLYHNLLVTNALSGRLQHLTILGNDLTRYFAPNTTCFIEGLLEALPLSGEGIARSEFPNPATGKAPLQIVGLESAVCKAVASAVSGFPKISKQQVSLAFSDLTLTRFGSSIGDYYEKVPRRRRKIRPPQGDMI